MRNSACYRLSLSIFVINSNFRTRFSPSGSNLNSASNRSILWQQSSTVEPAMATELADSWIFTRFSHTPPAFECPENCCTSLCIDVSYIVGCVIGPPIQQCILHMLEACRGGTAFQTSKSDTLKMTFFRHFYHTFSISRSFWWGGGLATPAQAGRLSIGIDSAGWNQHLWRCRPPICENFKKSEKKISVEKINSAIKFRFWPILLHIWKALGRPRRMVPPCQQQISTGEALLGGQRSIFSIFRRQCPH